MGPRYLLDTNIIIYYLGGLLKPPFQIQLDEYIQQGALLSVITKSELLSHRISTDEISLLDAFLNESIVIALSDPVIEKTIHIRKNFKSVKLPDAIIAATALSLNIPLITRNQKDFNLIDGLTIISGL